VLRAILGERRRSDVVLGEPVLGQNPICRGVPHGRDHAVGQGVAPDEEDVLRAAVADLVEQQTELGAGAEERLVQIEQVG
jgi:hypothetical protein